MKKTTIATALMSSALLTACVSPTMDQLPKQEPGKGVVALYSSSLQPTSYFNYSVNNQAAGNVEGGKVRIMYLTPGTYQFKADVPQVTVPVTKSLAVQSGQYYFINLYSTVSRNRGMTTTYHFDTVPKDEAMHYLEGPKKFTGWNDLVMNTITGKQFQ